MRHKCTSTPPVGCGGCWLAEDSSIWAADTLEQHSECSYSLCAMQKMAVRMNVQQLLDVAGPKRSRTPTPVTAATCSV